REGGLWPESSQFLAYFVPKLRFYASKGGVGQADSHTLRCGTTADQLVSVSLHVAQQRGQLHIQDQPPPPLQSPECGNGKWFRSPRQIRNPPNHSATAESDKFAPGQSR